MRVQELFDLSGKTAIVTGGGSGSGRQMAGALAELGPNLVRWRCSATCVNRKRCAPSPPAEDTPLEGWQKVVDLNLTGVFLFSQAAGRVNDRPRRRLTGWFPSDRCAASAGRTT
jgi:NAD(P)-dependent dehydrogenase (short-subunit alcohol dehydrogenase family)